MFRFFIVLRSLISIHGAQLGPNMGPKIDPNRPLRFRFTLPFWASMLEGLGRPIWDPSGTPLEAILGHLGAILSHLGGILAEMVFVNEHSEGLPGSLMII